MESSKMTMPEAASMPLQSQSSALEQNNLTNLEQAKKVVMDRLAEGEKESETVEEANPKIVKKMKANWTLPIPPPLPPNSIGAIRRRQRLEKEQQEVMESLSSISLTEIADEKKDVEEVSRKMRKSWKLPVPPPLPQYAIERIRRRQELEKEELVAQAMSKVVKDEIIPPHPFVTIRRSKRLEMKRTKA